MHQIVNRHMFAQAFRNLRPDNFSIDSLDALFDYFEQYEDDTGERIELDVIAICCDWCEYDSIQEACKELGLDTTDRSEDELDDESLVERLRDHTDVLTIEGSDAVVVRSY